MKRGDVIVCAFPHASGTPSKNCPAVVVQSDFYNQRIKNLLVAGVTTNAGDKAHYLIEVSTADGKQSGLSTDSLVSCINLAVIPPRDVVRKIGFLSNAALAEVDKCLKVALGL